MIKIMVCVFIISGCFILGSIKASGYKSRRIELEDSIEMMNLMHIEMTYKKEPIHKILISISRNKQSLISQAMEACSENLKEGKSLKVSWDTAASQIKMSPPLENNDMEILENMFYELGKTDIDGQSKLLKSVISKLSENLQKAYIREEKNGKMFRVIGFYAGLLICIIFI